MGDSITEGWFSTDPEFLPKNNFVGRGISGQVTSQMLLRFREDVIKLKPKRVIILAGTNDIAENQGPISLDKVFGNIVSMVS
jgi:lysophospholipase L1-like esterase